MSTRSTFRATTAPLVGSAERDSLLGEQRRLEAELRRRGVRRLRLFGSVARGEANPDSGVDLLAEIDRRAVAKFSLLDLIDAQHAIADGVGRPFQAATVLHKLHLRVRAGIEADAVELADATV